ncbi:hypothetical protein PV10_08737 [Exophiala mesophila]|uniref:DUF7732 domain-containing protein n=1 Tax=Exophiala mesophila TaxID=212818 RepID=A0A0D1Z5H3_EXOME|nr:uncharacterized protein PV10_08737 [Exophiala mesophila]KIV89144.1 hypothetical protein PV10_08737 [Exophiala mesophila]
MKFSIPLLTTLVYLSTFAASAPPPSSFQSDISRISRREAAAASSPLDSIHSLEKRKGGGGGRGSSGSSGGRTGSGTGGVGGGRVYSYMPNSNVGGRTISGSGTPKAFGNRYTGGAAVPYTAGLSSPTRGIAPFALPVAALAFFPGLWLYGSVFAYPYAYPYHWYHNGQNHTTNVTCLCQRYQVCGCDPDNDENGNSTFLDQLILNGTGEPVNSTNVRTVDFGNGSVSTFINGSLENGTTAAGGTDPSNDSQVSGAMRVVMEAGGYWVMIATVVVGTYMAA